MITNLFSSFDPATSSLFRLNWIRLLIPFLFIINKIWIFNSRIHFLFFFISNFLLNDLSKNINKNYQNNLLFFICLFWIIFSINIIGLFPYIFTSSRHLIFSLRISLSCWLTFIIFRFIFKINKFLYHLVPIGTPIILSPFIVLIESIRNIIRPITLAVRLSANLIAGHLLLILLSEINEKNNFLFIFIFPILLILIILEIAVALIQSYVFITLISLYYNEN